MTTPTTFVPGILGRASPEERDGIQRILRSLSGFSPDADLESVLADESWGDEPTQSVTRPPEETAADSIGETTDILWSDADEAVFRFRRGDTLGAASSLGRALSALRDSAPEEAMALASRPLLSYFVQRVLGLAPRFQKIRQTLEIALHRVEGASTTPGAGPPGKER